MLGIFQQSHLRIEVKAKSNTIRDSILLRKKLCQWLWPVPLSHTFPEKLALGLKFTTGVGLLTINHEVDIADDNSVRMLLSGGMDGYHEWYWGDGWVQSSLEVVSVLPVNLIQTLSLLRLREFVKEEK